MLAALAVPDPPASDTLSLADEIALLAAQLDAATHRLLTCIRRFDESQEWAHQGAPTCAHWLAWRIGLDPATAREKVRVARALGGLPLLDATLSRGEISYAKVRALTRVATVDNESVLCEMARAATGAQLERICRRFRQVTQEDRLATDLDERALRVRPLESGMLRIEITLHPDEADLVLQAIEKARDGLRAAAAPTSRVTVDTRDVSAETPALPALPRPSRADGLVSMAEHFLSAPAAAVPRGGGGDRYQVFVHLDRGLFGPEGTMDAFLDDGTRVSAEAFRRVICDAALVGVGEGRDGEPLDIGRRTRVIPPAIRRALWLRDRGCRFPACANRRFVHGHHIRHWAHGGNTGLDNLVLLCSFHHRLVHEGGFAVRRDERGAPLFIDPHGRPLAPAPPAVAMPPGAGAPGLPVPFDDPDTTLCAWDGDPADYDAAIAVLVGSSPAA